MPIFLQTVTYLMTGTYEFVLLVWRNIMGKDFYLQLTKRELYDTKIGCVLRRKMKREILE